MSSPDGSALKQSPAIFQTRGIEMMPGSIIFRAVPVWTFLVPADAEVPQFTAVEACVAAAKLVIQQWSENDDDKVTSSRLFKIHMAEYFCKLGSPSMTVLELGVHRGYTTLVWATIFRKVIAVDISEHWLRIAGQTTAEKSNVVFLTANLMADSWTIFRNNRVDAVIIDANHDYNYVRADAYNSLRHLPDLKYLDPKHVKK